MSDQPIHSALPLLLVVAKRIRFIVFVPLFFGLVALVVSKFSPPVYTAVARILPPQYNENTVLAMQNQLGGESQLGNSGLSLKNPTDLFVGILSSRTIGDGVIEEQGLQSHYGDTDMGETRAFLIKNTKIRAGKDGIVSIIVEDDSAQKSADIANAYINEFYAFSRDLAQQQSKRRSAFYSEAVNSAKEALLQADIQLSTIESETGFTRLTGQDEAIVQSAAELQAKISAREIQLTTMSGYATETNPDVVLIRRELSNLRKQLVSIQGSQLAESSTLPDDRPFVGLGNVPAVLLEHTRSARDVEYWESIVMWLGRFSEMGKIDERRDMSLFQVLDWAIAPYKKSGPRSKVNAILATIGTGFVCLLWVLLSAGIAHRRRRSSVFEEQWSELTRTLRNAVRLKKRNPT